MKKLFLLLIPFILVGAGCLGGSKTSSGADGGIFKTVNSGEDWAQYVVVPSARGIGTLATTNVVNLEMDPQDTQYLYASTRNNGMLFSEDGAHSWRQPKQTLLQEGTVYDVEVDPTDVCTVYVVTERKLVSTDNCFRTINDELYLENRADVGVLKVTVDWFNPNILWLGLSNGDVLKSDNKGEKWRTVATLGREISEIIVSNKDSRMVLVSTFSSGIVRTIDSGETWEEIEFPDGLHSTDTVYNIVQNPDSSVVIAATEYGLLRSINFGQTWESIKLLTSPAEVTIRGVAIDPKDSNILYYATPGTFYRSTDAGVTWKTQRFQTSRDSRVILIDPSNTAVLYIGVAAATK